MERFALILILLAGALASFATSAKDFAFSAKEKDKDEDYPLTAVMGINRGEYPGQYVTELRIGHTIYVSQDVCRKAEAQWNTAYPARRAKQDIWVLIGSTACKYRVTDEHPFLAHNPRSN
jgi:hypothetical protein